MIRVPRSVRNAIRPTARDVDASSTSLSDRSECAPALPESGSNQSSTPETVCNSSVAPFTGSHAKTSPRLLRWHVGGSADDLAVRGEAGVSAERSRARCGRLRIDGCRHAANRRALRVAHLRQPRVHLVHLAEVADQHAVGLQVAVDDALRVRERLSTMPSSDSPSM
jgi:hypothetical protein